MTLGSRVAAARQHAQLTQAELAQRVGITQQGIQKLEDGRSKKSAALADICIETGVSLRWLARNEGDMLAASVISRPDVVILGRAITVLKNLARLQAGEASFLYDAHSILAIYDQLTQEPPDLDLDREGVLGRMAAVLRGIGNGKGMGRGDAVGAR